MAPPALSARGLEQCYHGRRVLRVPELAVEAGSVLTVLGPNGSGKSTLLRLLGLLERPAAGTIAYSGHVPTDEAQRLAQRRKMVMIMQDPLLFAGTVRQNVAYGLRLRGVPGPELARRTAGVLELLGLSALAGRHVSTLSGGEAQKAALARALVLEPEVMFLDEPTAYLDVPARRDFLQRLLTLLADLGLTVVFVTHDRAEARLLDGQVAVLFEGEISQCGPAAEVFAYPVDARTAAFLGVENLLSARAVRVAGGVRVETGGVRLGSSADWPGPQVTVGLRPDDLRLVDDGEQPDNLISGTVRGLWPEGPALRLEADAGVPIQTYVTAAEARRRGLRPGVPVRLTVEPDRVLVYGRGAT